MGEYKKKLNRQRHEFLLTFFPPNSQSMEKEVNGFILVKYFSNNTKKWEVRIFPKDSWNTHLSWKQKQTLNQVKLL